MTLRAFRGVTCDNETSRQGAGHTTDGSDHEGKPETPGAHMADASLSPVWTSKVARGAASELIASAHLMAQGYHVFRAVASSCPVDLVAYRDGELLRVEVKSVALNLPYNPAFPAIRNSEWDILVTIVGETTAVMVTAKPAIEEVKADYFAELGRLGLLRTPREFTVGPLCYPTSRRSAHFLNASTETPTTICGLGAQGWLGGREGERTRAESLPLCGTCARYLAESEAA